jgi:hypothetical protein
MSYGITRKNGTSYPGSFYGYQTRFFTVAAAGFYTNTGTSYTAYASNSPFELAVRNGIEQYATVTVLGTPTSGGFTFAIDGDTMYGRDEHTGYAGDSSTATFTAGILAATGITATVTEVILSGTGLTAGTVANWDNIV